MEKAEDLNELRQRLLKEDWQLKLYDPLPPHVSEEQAAGLCLELATGHAERVRALLSAQPKVAEAAKALLLQEKDPKQMRQLALAVLDSGHRIREDKKHPESVKQLLDDRNRASWKKWKYKHEKYEKAKEKSKSERDRLENLSYTRTEFFRPYLSLNPKYNEKNRNGELNSKGNKDFCRHWSAAMQGDRATVKKLLQAAAQGDPVITDAHREAGDRGKDVIGPGQVAFSRENFGQLLAALVPQLPLQAGEEQSFPVGFAVASNGGVGHAMRLYIGREKKKQNDDPSPFFQIALFEPNVTGDRMHTTELPENLGFLKFDHFDVRRVCKQSGAEILSIQVWNAELAQHMAGQFVAPDVTHQQFAFVNALYARNAAGMRAAIKELSGKGLHELKATPNDQKAIFFMKDSEGNSGVHFALQEGYPDVIKALGEALIKFNLDPAEQKEVILAKSRRGVPGLFMALQYGHADAIKALGEILRQCKLDPAALKEILLAKNHLGIPGLFMALLNGHADAIKALGEILRQSKLDPADQMEILFPKNHLGIPGLFIALQDGHADAIKALGEILCQSELNPTRLKEITLSKNDRGVPGLYMAFVNGQADAIKALGEALIKFNLDPADQKEILLAKDDRGNPGLFAALLNGHADAIKALGEILRQSKLDPAALKEILLAKDSRGISGLCGALFGNRAGAINAMGDILHVGARDHRLDSSALSEILTPPSKGGNGLGCAMKDGCLEAAQAYAETLIRLQEDPETQLRGEDAKKVLDYLNEAMKQKGVARTPELDSALQQAGTLLKAAAAA